MDKQIDILVIDDNDIQREFLGHLFDSHGFTSFATADNTDVINTINETKPRVLLLDLMMPNVDGYTILKTIRETEGLENLPVIIYTSKSYPVDQNKAMRLGANSYLIKPIKGSDIIAEVKKYI